MDEIFALPGRDTAVNPNPADHPVLGTNPNDPIPEGYEVIYFGMGCFWGAEKFFWTQPGVYNTAVGYYAGKTPNPTYREVCTGGTGHVETVRVIYDPEVIDTAKILKVFWENHFPDQGNRQGNDVGTQYRSLIGYTTAEQRDLACIAG